MEPYSLLLVLVLVAGRDDVVAAKALGAIIDQAGADRVEVVLGRPAAERLQEYGITGADLLASPHLGRQLTDHHENLVIIHLDRLEHAGDQLIEAQLWFDGRAENHTAITNAEGDPVQVAAHGVLGILGARLKGEVGDAGQEATSPAPDLPDLVKQERWEQVLGRVAGIDQPSPRECYYQVLAYNRLGRRDAAVAALNAMRASHDGHFLITAASELIPAPAHGARTTIDLPTSDVLSDENLDREGRDAAPVRRDEATVDSEPAIDEPASPAAEEPAGDDAASR